MKSNGSVSEIVGSLLPFVLILLFGWFWSDYVRETHGPHGPRSEQERRRMEERYLGSNPERQARNLVRSGRDLTEEQAEIFEARAADGDLSEAGRARLIGYYSRLGWRDQEARLAHGRHVLWFIENQPNAKLLLDHAARLDASHNLPAYVKAKELWMEYLEQFPNDLSIKANAVEGMKFSDRDLCIEILKDAEKLDPANGKWAKSLGFIYCLEMSLSSLRKGREQATQSLAAYERAYRLLGSVEQPYVLADLASTAYFAVQKEKARGYAEELVSSESRHGRDHMLHVGHSILGLLALDEGNVDSAKEHLLASVTLPDQSSDGFPPLPVGLSNVDYQLARRLLEVGAREAVRHFIEQGKPLFGLDEPKVPEWLESLDKGLVPNFEGL